MRRRRALLPGELTPELLFSCRLAPQSPEHPGTGTRSRLPNHRSTVGLGLGRGSPIIRAPWDGVTGTRSREDLDLRGGDV